MGQGVSSTGEATLGFRMLWCLPIRIPQTYTKGGLEEEGFNCRSNSFVHATLKIPGNWHTMYTFRSSLLAGQVPDGRKGTICVAIFLAVGALYWTITLMWFFYSNFTV